MSGTPAPVICQKCGTVNQPIARFCIACGTQLLAVLQSSPLHDPAQSAQASLPPSLPQAWSVPYSPYAYYAYTVAYYEAQRREQVDRTITGLLLIAIGFFLSWIPFINLIGGIIELVGAILVILGRKAFGTKHARNVFWSVIIFVVGLVSTIVTFFVVIFYSIVSTAGSPSTIASPFGGSVPIVSLVATTVIGFVYVIFVYELEEKSGRILLWCGYVANIATAATNLLVLTNLSVVAAVQLLLVDILIGIIPAVLFGVAYFLARERIVRGEIPGPMQPLH